MEFFVDVRLTINTDSEETAVTVAGKACAAAVDDGYVDDYVLVKVY